MRKNKWRGKVPFDENGNFMGNIDRMGEPDKIWDSALGQWIPLKWEEWYTFRDTMTLEPHSRLRDSKGRLYHLFPTERYKLTYGEDMKVGDTITATWGFTKKGMSSSICLIKEDNTD